MVSLPAESICHSQEPHCSQPLVSVASAEASLWALSDSRCASSAASSEFIDKRFSSEFTDCASFNVPFYASFNVSLVLDCSLSCAPFVASSAFD